MFRAKLRARDVAVEGVATARRTRPHQRSIGRVTSAPLLDVLHRMNVPSSNFRAEVLGKWFALARGGSIDAAADRIFSHLRGRMDDRHALEEIGKLINSARLLERAQLSL